MTEENKQESLSTEAENITRDNLSDSQVRDVLSPGVILKARRESTGAELEVIARELNLDPWMLHALENDEFSKFGAQVFAKGHLKHYAQHLGLNPDDVLFAYYQVAERKETTPIIKRHISSASQKRSYGSVLKWFGRLLALIAIAALLYAAYKFSQSWLDGAKSSSDTTEITLAPSNTSASNGVDTDTSAIAPPTSSIDYASNDNETVSNSQTQDLSNTEVQDTNSATVDAAEQALNADSNVVPERNLLRLVFNEESWVEVFDADNNSLLYDIQQANTQQELTLNGTTSIFLGNYPGVELYFNGSEYTIPRRSKAGNTARFVIEPE